MSVVPKRAAGCYWTHELPSPDPAPRPSSLTIALDRLENVVVARISGRLDSAIDRDLKKVFDSLIWDEKRVNILVDMEGLLYLNSRGVSVFIAVLDQIREKGGDLKIARAKRSCSLVLERLGISSVIQSFTTVEEGIAAFDTPIKECLSDGGLETFVAGESAKVYHVPRCASVKRLRRVTPFASQKAAREAGLRACRRCL